MPAVSYNIPFVNTLEIDPDTGRAILLDYDDEHIYIFISQWL